MPNPRKTKTRRRGTASDSTDAGQRGAALRGYFIAVCQLLMHSLCQVDLLEDKIDDLQRQLTLRDATLTDLTYVKIDLAKNLRKVEKERDMDKATIARLSTEVNDRAVAYKALYQEKLDQKSLLIRQPSMKRIGKM
ncbi:hypothetical protein MHYP_G00240190 [Metynnis hypsauchen]